MDIQITSILLGTASTLISISYTFVCNACKIQFHARLATLINDGKCIFSLEMSLNLMQRNTQMVNLWLHSEKNAAVEIHSISHRCVYYEIWTDLRLTTAEISKNSRAFCRSFFLKVFFLSGVYFSKLSTKLRNIICRSHESWRCVGVFCIQHLLLLLHDHSVFYSNTMYPYVIYSTVCTYVIYLIVMTYHQVAGVLYLRTKTEIIETPDTLYILIP